MSISKDLLDKLNDNDLALACDKASVHVKILVASWDGLASSEAEALEKPLEATILSMDEVKAIFQAQLEGLRAGKPIEDDLLKQTRETMEKVPEALKAEIGRALFDEALSVLTIDKVLSGQEREVIRDELAPACLVSAEAANEALDKIAADLKAAADAK